LPKSEDFERKVGALTEEGTKGGCEAEDKMEHKFSV
jgi:hypothetical protein